MPTTILKPFVSEVNAELPPQDYKPVIEYYEPKYSLVIRAHVIGHVIHKDTVRLIVQPIASKFCDAWVDMPDDGTTLSICASKMIAQVS